MESFLGSLAMEKTVRAQARAEVFDYSERFYNLVRRRSTLGYVSPSEFEKA
jgi:putative transposase